jgi:hypothetical protein
MPVRGYTLAYRFYSASVSVQYNCALHLTACTDPQCLYMGAHLILPLQSLIVCTIGHFTVRPVQSISSSTIVHFTVQLVQSQSACTEQGYPLHYGL